MGKSNTYDAFDPLENGGREICDCKDGCPRCCQEVNQDNDDWPCIYVNGHPGKHMDIWGMEWLK